MTNRKILLSVSAITAFLINPNLGCGGGGSEDDDFTYEEADMQAAVLGTWTGTLEIGDTTETITLELEQATAESSPSFSPPSERLQCGSREFIKSAAACASMSSMPLVGTLSSVSGDLDGPITGQAMAYYTLDSWELEVSVEDGVALSGNFHDGKFEGGMATGADSTQGEFSLQRPTR
jgi:hypothetical protein